MNSSDLDGGSEPTRRRFRPGKLLDAFLGSPFAGLTPWIVMALMSGPGRFEESVCAALGLSIVLFVTERWRGSSVKLLEMFGLTYFGVMALIGLFASAGTTRWLELWSGELANIALTLFAIGSIVVGNPFTLQYARESTPQEFWSNPVFLKVNYVITAAWAGAFGFNSVVGAIGDAVLHDPHNFWTGWILPIAAIVFAAEFTAFYREYATSHARQQAGQPGDPPPSRARLFDWVPIYVGCTGIAGLVSDSLHAAVGIVLIIAGFGGHSVLRRAFPS